MFTTLLAAGNAENNIDLLDNLIYIVIVLFILSAITEKMTQLVRCYAKQFQIICLTSILLFYGLIIYSLNAKLPPGADASERITNVDFWVLILVNTAFLVLFILNYPAVKRAGNALGSFAQEMAVLKNINKSGSDGEKTRDITLLSFILGFLITYLFNADLLRLFTRPKEELNLGWDVSPFIGDTLILNSKFFGFDVAIAAGFLITGFFLAFGSKFFHDLLDTLLQVKNLKRKLNEEATYEAETIAQFDEHLAKSSSAIIDIAIDQNATVFRPELLTIPPLHGRMKKEGRIVDCIDLHLKGHSRENIPEYVEAKLEKGLRVKVPINVVYGVEIPTVKSIQGETIAAQETSNFKGTICCRLKNDQGKIHLLTCSHVLNNGKAKNDFGTLSTKAPVLINGVTNGDFVWALRSDKLDIALIEPAPADSFQYTIQPRSVRALSPSDIYTTSVKVVRQNKHIGSGRVMNYKFPRAINIGYADGVFGILNLIILSNTQEDGDNITYHSITAEGDSGAGVYDDTGNLIGMIVAGNSMFSYAIAIPEILAKTNSVVL